MAVLAALFLAAYAWPVIQPDLDASAQRACTVVVWVVWVAFAVEYVIRLWAAERRSHWFLRHLLDLFVLVVPVARPLRLLRLVTLVRVLNRSAAASLRGRIGVYVAGGSGLLAFVAAVAVLDAERGAPDANIQSFGDALWWAGTTMTTVGYGDRFPTTGTGRLVGAGLMVAGIALLGTVTATLASWLVAAVAADTSEAGHETLAAEADIKAEIKQLQEQVRALAAALQNPQRAGS